MILSRPLATESTSVAATRPISSHARIELNQNPVNCVTTTSAVNSNSTTKEDTKKRLAFLTELDSTRSLPQVQVRVKTKPLATNLQQQQSCAATSVGISEASEEDTDEFKKAMWAGQSNILVAVRLRPHLGHDRDNGEIVKVLDNKVIVVLDQTSQRDPIRKMSHRTREKRYAFDYVFTPDDGQETVYCNTTKFLIHGVLNGFNATVFAYGCTGAGKTYTMLGTPDEPGIMALTLDDLFEKISQAHADPQGCVTYRVSVSFLEIYNENIHDLLAFSTSEPLELREDPMKGIVVAGISEVEALNAQEVMKLLRKGNKNRTQEATAANSVSSRSHAILQVVIEQNERTPGAVSSVKYGKLSLVDLAGSERAAVTQNRGLRLVEGANINRSLLALGNCINALGEKANKGMFVPYRDSKLTRLLKDSLGGNCRTVMIANVSMAASSFEETVNTLKYANRAKNIKTTVARNVLNVNHHITEYVTLISSLKDEILMLKNQLQLQGIQSPMRPAMGKDSTGSSSTCSLGGSSSSNLLLPSSFLRHHHQPNDHSRHNNNNNNHNNNDEEEDDPGCGEPVRSHAGNSQTSVVDPDHSSTLSRTNFRDARLCIIRSFQERLQLRRSLIELENQNVALSVEIGKHQLILTELRRQREEKVREEKEQALLDKQKSQQQAQALVGVPTTSSSLPPSQEVQQPQAPESNVAGTSGSSTRSLLTTDSSSPQTSKSSSESPNRCSPLKEQANPVKPEAAAAALLIPHRTPASTSVVPRPKSSEMRNLDACIREESKLLDLLQKQLDANQDKKSLLVRKIKKNEQLAEEFRVAFEKNITNEEKRELMLMEYRIGKLELEKMELELRQRYFASVVQQKEIQMEKLQFVLQLKEKTIAKQQAVLEKHGLQQEVSDGLFHHIEEATLYDGFDSLCMSMARLTTRSEVDLGKPIHVVSGMSTTAATTTSQNAMAYSPKAAAKNATSLNGTSPLLQHTPSPSFGKKSSPARIHGDQEQLYGVKLPLLTSHHQMEHDSSCATLNNLEDSMLSLPSLDLKDEELSVTTLPDIHLDLNASTNALHHTSATGVANAGTSSSSSSSIVASGSPLIKSPSSPEKQPSLPPDQQQPQQPPPPQQQQQQQQPNNNDQDNTNARRQWSLNLNNTSLPYIRIKKKSPSNVIPKSITAPYLKVLKHRRKKKISSSVTASLSDPMTGSINNNHTTATLVLASSGDGGASAAAGGAGGARGGGGGDDH